MIDSNHDYHSILVFSILHSFKQQKWTNEKCYFSLFIRKYDLKIYFCFIHFCDSQCLKWIEQNRRCFRIFFCWWQAIYQKLHKFLIVLYNIFADFFPFIFVILQLDFLGKIPEELDLFSVNIFWKNEVNLLLKIAFDKFLLLFYFWIHHSKFLLFWKML